MQDDRANRTKKEDVIKSLKFLDEVLKAEHQNSLRFLPGGDMFIEVIKMLEATEEESSETKGHSRSGSYNPKTTDQERKVEELSQELKLLKEENRENKRFKKLAEEYKEELSRKDQEIEEMKIRFEQLKENYMAQMSNKDKEIKQMEISLTQKTEDFNAQLSNRGEETEQMKTRFRQLTKQYKGELSNKDEEIAQLKRRIAVLSERRVKQDQSNVEDTSSANRQSVLEENFSSFIDNDREDVRDRLKEMYNNDGDFAVHVFYPRLACLIFEAAYERMEEAKEALSEVFKEVSRSLIEDAPTKSSEFTRNKNWWYPRNSYHVSIQVSLLRRNSKFSAEVIEALMLAVKENAHECKLDFFVKDVRKYIMDKWQSWSSAEKSVNFSPDDSILFDPKIALYIEKCVRLSWRMVTQVPAMRIEYQSTILQSFHQNLGYYGGMGKSREGEEIAIYILPALFDGGGRLVRAAEVLCKPPLES